MMEEARIRHPQNVDGYCMWSEGRGFQEFVFHKMKVGPPDANEVFLSTK